MARQAGWFGCGSEWRSDWKILPDSELINAASLLCVPAMGDKNMLCVMTCCALCSDAAFAGEKNFNPHYLIIKLSKQYRFHPVNQCFCLVEYQPDGMTANIWKQYVNSPRSFAELRRAIMDVPGLTWQYQLKKYHPLLLQQPDCWGIGTISGNPPKKADMPRLRKILSYCG